MSLDNCFHPTQVKTDKSLICEEVRVNSRAKIYLDLGVHQNSIM